MTSMSANKMDEDAPRDHSVEAWIERFGATWVLRHVAVDVIDEQRSLRNQARMESIRETKITRMVEAYKGGVEFPPVIAHGRRGGLVLVDGNHRLETYRRVGESRVWVYEIDAPPDVIATMTIAANAELNGDGPSDEDRRAHLRQLLDRGVHHQLIARYVATTLTEVSRESRSYAAERRAYDLGFGRQFDALPRAVHIKLNTIRADAAFTHLIQWFRSHPDLASDATMRRVAKVARATEGSDAKTVAAVAGELDIIEREAAQAKASGKTTHRSPVSTFYATLRAISGFDVETVLTSVPDTFESKLPTAIDEAISNLERAREKIHVH